MALNPPGPPTFDRPFPALTPAQRYHFELYGYVVIPNTLAPAEVALLREALYRLRDSIQQLPERGPEGPRSQGAYFLIDRGHHHFMANVVEADPAITAYATHPRLVAMAEEVMGSEARITEMNAHINSRDRSAPLDPAPKYGFHRGADVPFFCHTQEHLFHCAFVKTLTNLTDLGPEDGGTVVIAGSHKVDLPAEQLLQVAYADRSLIHQVVAPAGSTLLFAETLIHATGQVRSDRERVILITGYGPTLFPYWDEGKLSEGFSASIPPQLRPLFQGREHWTRGPRYRKLTDPMDARQFSLGQWDQRPLPEEPKP
ncbi:MAG: phytanoyl-CoA dioxygenase family protein [Candidatus Handelsmanbacteria bacterium]|nr:phytanoyl-CoA dioxygenase family protein [Candidatus Handelsmanbacteria bacterium]